MTQDSLTTEQEVRLMGYILGECSEQERGLIEKELASSPTQQQWVDEMQALAAIISSELGEHSAPGLHTTQHERIHQEIDARVIPEMGEPQETVKGDASDSPQPSAQLGEPEEPALPSAPTRSWRWIGLASSVACLGLLLLIGPFRVQLQPAKHPTKRLVKPRIAAIQSPKPIALLPGAIPKLDPSGDTRNTQPQTKTVTTLTATDGTTKKQDDKRLDGDPNVDKGGDIELRSRLARLRLNADKPSTTFQFGIWRNKSRLALLDGKDLHHGRTRGNTNGVTGLAALGKNQQGQRPGNGERKAEKKPKDTGSKSAQVWQRSKQNTVLSKVSVGGGKHLILKKMRVTVSVEGMRARTVIDHIYYNPYGRTLQGTFKYTLPPRASVSYYAMFVGHRRRAQPRFFGAKLAGQNLARIAPQVLARKAPKRDWGRLREARLVPAVKARKVYENIVRRRIDPALLEQDAPNTFKGRVFPIRSKGYNRIIIAYEQTLPQLRDELVYRFRFPQQVAQSIDFSLDYDRSNAALKRSNLRKIRCRAKTKDGSLRCMWEDNKPDRDAVFYFKPKNQQVHWVTGVDPVDDKKYLYAKVKVSLPTSQSFGASQALFALDTSLSGNPDLFAAQARLLLEILKRNRTTLKRFNILFFDTGANWMSPKGWLKNNATQRARVRSWLSKILLEGATSLGGALRALARPGWKNPGKAPVDIFFLSDGKQSWGQDHLEASIADFRKHHPYGSVRFFTYHMGIGSENVQVSMRLAREGGALFTCLGRAELAKCAKAHTKAPMKLNAVKLEGIGASELVVEGRQVHLFPGAWLGLAARYQRAGNVTLVLKGTYQGRPITIRRPFSIKTRGELAPRAWAEMVVQQLSGLQAPKLKPLIVAYSQHFRIPNKHCSFLVLETDKEYKQYGLEKRKAARRVKDIAKWMVTWRNKSRQIPTLRERWRAVLRTGAKQAGILGMSAGRAVFSLMNQLSEQELALVVPSSHHIWWKADVPKAYLDTRLHSRKSFGAFTKEAKRRLRKDPQGAVRSLSSIVELHPGNPKALRLVGYYLLSWKRPEEAANIFWRILSRRSFEPHAYRDLAKSLLQMKRYGLAAALYEILIARQWHRRFGAIHTIAREEYALLLHEALQGKLSFSLKQLLRRRKAVLGLQVQRANLRVSVTWNTDNTDIDLWVTEPDGTQCSYRHKRTHNGGELFQDLTQGYGPERYRNTRGVSGTYKIRLHYYGHSTNTFGNETHALVTVVLHAGTPQQKIIEKHVILKRAQQFTKVLTLRL